ncbi:hypothetical protein Vretimale_7927 [Volvox reticuliferus]|uniref:Uncharacterized protein n=1 Tax=Volvox reticuliferus TaxID=1737510 RepID=A0A8J4LNP9_9CHLO|nr:hypothetical protein Vretifemale_5064 [Volvox reticuliferus]GIM03137.1 hypothetical protein Vretimale_7927 [Volvox reticuliferus]
MTFSVGLLENLAGLKKEPPKPTAQRPQVQLPLRLPISSDAARLLALDKQIIRQLQGHDCCNRGRRTTVGNLPSAPGVPEPGTVQDQSSCILLLLRQRRWRRSSMPVPPSPARGGLSLETTDATAPIEPRMVATVARDGGGQAINGDVGDSGCTDAGGFQGGGASGVEQLWSQQRPGGRDAYLGNAVGGYTTMAGPASRDAHRTASTIRTTAATTPTAMAAMTMMQRELRLQKQRGRHRQEQCAVLAPLWEGQAWMQPSRGSLMGPHGAESPHAAVSDLHSNVSWRKQPTLPGLPVATAAVVSERTAGAMQEEMVNLKEGTTDPCSGADDMLEVICGRRQPRRRLALRDSSAHTQTLQHCGTEARPESGEEVATTALDATGIARRAQLQDSDAGEAGDAAQVAVGGATFKEMLETTEPVAIATMTSAHSASGASQWRATVSAVSVEDNRAAFLARLSATPAGNASAIAVTVRCHSSALQPALLPSPTRAPAIITAVAATAAGTRTPAADSTGVRGSRDGGSGEECRIRRHENVKEDNLRRRIASAACGGNSGISVSASDAATARRLMRALLACRHWRQLSALVDEYSTSFNVLHLTAALGKLTRIQLPSPPTFSHHRAGLTRRPGGPERSRAGYFDAFEGEAAEVHKLLSELEAAFRHHLEAACAGRGLRTHAKDSWNGSRSNGSSRSHSPACVAAVHTTCDMSLEATGIADTGTWEPDGEEEAGAPVYNMEPYLGPRQLATSLAALARLRSGGWRVARDETLLQAAVEVSECWLLKSLPAQELTTLVYAFAKLDHYPGRVWMDSACAAGGGAAASRLMSPRQLSTFLWALATLRHQPGEVFMTAWIQGAVRAMARFSSYDISQALWALATLHRAHSPQPHVAVTATAAAVAEPAPPAATAAPPHGLPEVFVHAALGRAKAALLRPGCGSGGCAPQDICNTLWAVSQLQLAPPQRWVQAVAAALLASPDATLERCQPADLAGLLWALARLTPDAPPPRGPMLRILRAVARIEGRCGEQDLANIFWALGVFRFRPPQPVMRTFGMRLLKLSVQGDAGPQLLSTALWCCVRLHLPPHPVLLRHLLVAAARRAPEFDPRSAPLLLYSLARLHHLGWFPLESWQPWRTHQQRPVPHAVERPAAALAWPAATSPPLSRGKGTTATEAAPTAPSLPLDVRPFLNAALRGMAEVEVEGRRPRLALPVLLWSVAKLGQPPDEGWTRSYLAHSFEVLPMLSPEEASLVISALLRLGQLPPPLWLDRMEHLTARRWGPAAEREAGELQRQVASLRRRAAAAAAAATAAPLAVSSDEVLESTTVARFDNPLADVTATRSDEWRLRQLQRRRQVAARVLGKRLEWCRARLSMLRHSMARLRRGLVYLRARVRQQQRRHDSIMAAVTTDALD